MLNKFNHCFEIFAVATFLRVEDPLFTRQMFCRNKDRERKNLFTRIFNKNIAIIAAVRPTPSHTYTSSLTHTHTPIRDGPAPRQMTGTIKDSLISSLLIKM